MHTRGTLRSEDFKLLTSYWKDNNELEYSVLVNPVFLEMKSIKWKPYVNL